MLHAQKRIGSVATETEAGAVCPRVRKCQKSLRVAATGLPTELAQGAQPTLILASVKLISDFCEKMLSSCFKSPVCGTWLQQAQEINAVPVFLLSTLMYSSIFLNM